jgi:hypothetical protein
MLPLSASFASARPTCVRRMAASRTGASLPSRPLPVFTATLGRPSMFLFSLMFLSFLRIDSIVLRPSSQLRYRQSRYHRSHQDRREGVGLVIILHLPLMRTFPDLSPFSSIIQVLSASGQTVSGLGGYRLASRRRRSLARPLKSLARSGFSGFALFPSVLTSSASCAGLPLGFQGRQVPATSTRRTVCL